ncbi:MAG: TonB-dependent receptor [Sphingobacteriaceae bacterium]|nr:MAG: TonB-dependent receptor [Sphingobacteriaceae bacterium]
MRSLYITLFILTLSLRLAAQAPATQAKPATEVPPALEFRDVNGIVKDENDDPVPNATVHLKSPLDSMYTKTNNNGVFIFKQVRRAGFYITVSAKGLTNTVLLRHNDLSKQLVLDPIELTPPKGTELKEVTINGKPTIIYKQDTTEFKASDYKVREGDRLDELLKKMDGFDVGRDGTLLYQGQKVEKARLNGKDFLGGSVATVIQTLPADIIEKAQVIDDYGEQAARTGIKDTDPKKMLNVTTKPDRSIGTLLTPSVQAGNDERYNANVTLTRLNANRQIALTGRINNTQTGVASGINGGGGAGTTFSASPGISYSDQWTKLRLTTSYNYMVNDNRSSNKSFGETYLAGRIPGVINTSIFNSETTANNYTDSHRGTARVSYEFDKANFLQIEPTYSYGTTNTNNTSYSDRINNFDTGFEHLVSNNVNENISNNKNVGLTALYQHYFLKKPRRNFSIQLGYSNADNNSNGRTFTTYGFFADQTQNNRLRPDSVAHLQTRRSNINNTFTTSATYLEPLTAKSQLEFVSSINHQAIDNVAKQDTVLGNGQLQEITRLSNIFNYTFTEARLRFNYAYNGEKVNLSIGATAMPTSISGTRVNNNNNQTVSSSNDNFRVMPVLRFTYIWSTTERLSLSYSGNNTIPNFQQIQPFTDRADPRNIITGNPNLKPAFTNSLSASYNNYIANSKVTIGITVNASQILNQVTTNILQYPVLIATGPDRYSTVFETTYVNLNGSHSASVNYNFAKQLADRRYTLSFSGNVNYGYNVAMGNNNQYHTTIWNINQRFSPRINPNDNIEINPYIAYDIQRSFTSTVGSNSTLRQTLSLAIDGRFYLGAWRLNYGGSKNYVTGLGPLNSNPLVLNAGVERQLNKNNNFWLTFNVYDILKQNNFIQQNITPQGVTNTLSNALSRYFMVGLRATFQKWGGRPQRNGKELKRKGDGSFIY